MTSEDEGMMRRVIVKERQKRAFGFRIRRSAFRTSAFTMVEIAICLAVIAFALVAIMGVLPSGLRVQQDNREETIINQDGQYWMEAIRSGSQGLHQLTNYVTDIEVHALGNNGITVTKYSVKDTPVPCQLDSGTNIIGTLSTPQFPLSFLLSNSIVNCQWSDKQGAQVIRTVAKVRSISGSAVEKGDMTTLTFEYLLTSEIVPFHSFDPTLNTNVIKNLQENLYEIRLTFRWPVLPNGNPGTGRKVFRSLISGQPTTNQFGAGWFFRGGSYRMSTS
jgi:type II secretory pathway pseudopilin PulG